MSENTNSQTDQLRQFTATLKKQSDELTYAFLDLQQQAEAAWSKYEAAKKALQSFRSEFGPVLKAIETVEAQGSMKLTVEDIETVEA
jgi:hypothetical protein